MRIRQREGDAVLDIARTCRLFHQHRRQSLGNILQGDSFQQCCHLSKSAGQDTQGCKRCLWILEQNALYVFFCKEQDHGFLFGNYRGRISSIIEDRNFCKCAAGAFHSHGLFAPVFIFAVGTERPGNSHIQSSGRFPSNEENFPSMQVPFNSVAG